MSGIVFRPTGTLDVASNPSILGDGDFRRCRNLRLDRKAMACTRDGSTKLNASAIETYIRYMIEQGGVRYVFGGTQVYRDEVSIATGFHAAQGSAFLYNPYGSSTQAVFFCNGQERKKFEGSTVLEWGIAPPDFAPVLTSGAGSGLTGDYNAKYTYCRKDADGVILCESNPSDAASLPVTLTDQSLSITWTASDDPQVTHVRVYRTAADGETYYHEQDIEIGTVTLDSDAEDGDLGNAVETTHDRPPSGALVCVGPDFNGYCFIAVDNRLYYCLAQYPEYWPAAYYLEIGTRQYPIKSLVLFNGQLYVLTALDIYQVNGTDYQSFFPVPLSALCGTVSARATAAVVGYGIVHLGTDGLYLFTGAGDKKISDDRFGPVFRGEALTNGMPGINLDEMDKCWMAVWAGRLYFAYPSTDSVYPDALIVIDLTDGRAAYHEYGRVLTAGCVDRTNGRLLAADVSGYVWHLEDPAAADDGGTAISWELQSKDYAGSTSAKFPRWAKYDVELDPGAAGTGRILLDDVVHQEHALAVGRQGGRRRLIRTGNGTRTGFRISGTGPAKIYEVSAD